ncbi:hypothetical protein GC163_07695 [bacterium]|nr:hypothetical protein [bacterium]
MTEVGLVETFATNQEQNLQGVMSPLNVTTASVIFICSPSFSGSTMLDLMLGHGPNTFSCGEVGFWYRPVESRHHQLLCSCGDSDCPVWESMLTVPAEKFHQQALAAGQYASVIDSTKRLAWIIDGNRWARRHDQSVANIAIWKSPQLYAYSWWKRGKTIEAALTRYVRYYRQLAECRLPIVSVCYDELVEQPAERLQEVCRSVGVPYFPGKEYFWHAETHLAYGNANTRQTLASTTPQIYRPAAYPADFVEQYESLQNRSWTEPLYEVVAWLRRADVWNLTAEAAQKQARPFKRPFWYYRQTWKRIWQSQLQRLCLRDKS